MNEKPSCTEQKIDFFELKQKYFNKNKWKQCKIQIKSSPI